MNLEKIFESVLREGRPAAMYRVGDIVENDERRRGTISYKEWEPELEEYIYTVDYDDGGEYEDEDLPESMIFNLIERPGKTRKLPVQL